MQELGLTCPLAPCTLAAHVLASDTAGTATTWTVPAAATLRTFHGFLRWQWSLRYFIEVDNIIYYL